MTVDDETAEITVPWFWGGVPEPDATEEQQLAWADHVVEMFDEWTRDGWDEGFRTSWTAEGGLPEDYPFTADNVGRGIARWLTDRAATLPDWQRMAWGTAFVQGWPRWSPVPVVVEYRAPVADDPIYLMELVGAGSSAEAGADGVADRQIEYVTTPHGDGLRVLSVQRTPDHLAYGRLDAAMRLDWPADGDRPAARVDVLLTTRVMDLQLLGLIGPGVEVLMQQIAENPKPISTPALTPQGAAR
ncbi:hypothetical protein [Catenulispora rubra]|uniref:hypothetical protein n=1 Tax=Catenulispora rubra TaxID=280293 RepID=UPI0018923AA9|nr:hypothetical protein [Catenulispora rubra]